MYSGRFEAVGDREFTAIFRSLGSKDPRRILEAAISYSLCKGIQARHIANVLRETCLRLEQIENFAIELWREKFWCYWALIRIKICAVYNESTDLSSLLFREKLIHVNSSALDNDLKSTGFLFSVNNFSKWEEALGDFNDSFVNFAYSYLFHIRVVLENLRGNNQVTAPDNHNVFVSLTGLDHICHHRFCVVVLLESLARNLDGMI